MFSIRKQSRDGLQSRCKTCISEHRMMNIDKYAERDRLYRETRPASHLVVKKAWANANPGKSAAYRRAWAATSDGAAYLRARTAARRALKRMATPVFANVNKINAVYIRAQKHSRDGFSVDVDHIVPLKGKAVAGPFGGLQIVCGLHTHTNLRILFAEENRKKKDKFDQEAASLEHMQWLTRMGIPTTHQIERIAQAKASDD